MPLAWGNSATRCLSTILRRPNDSASRPIHPINRQPLKAMLARGIGFAALILTASLPQPAFSGDVAAAQTTSSRAAEASRLMLRLRPGARPADGQPLPAATLAELQRHLGVRLAGSTVTAAGNHVVLLETPVSAVAMQLPRARRAAMSRGRGAGVRRRVRATAAGATDHIRAAPYRDVAEPELCRHPAKTPTCTDRCDAPPSARPCMSCARCRRRMVGSF